MLEEAVNACDPDVIQPLGAIAHHARGQQRFFRDRNVAGSRRDDENLSLAGYLLIALDRDYAGESMKLRHALHGRIRAPNGFKNDSVRASDEDILPAAFMPQHGLNNFPYLLGRLALGKNDFGVSLAQRAMMIHLGEAQILKGEVLQ